MADTTISESAGRIDELTERLNFSALGPDVKALLEGVRSIVDREVPVALEKFYRRAKGTPSTAHFFADEGVTARAKAAQILHWQRISRGQFDASFLETVRRIGKTHARIGLSPQWYIGGYGLILDHLIGAVVKASFPGGFLRKRSRPEQVGASMGALARAMLLDLELAVSVYLQALDDQRQAAERERIVTQQQAATAVSTIAAALKALATKTLDYRVTAELAEAYRPLSVDFNGSIEQLQFAMQTVGSVAKGISSASAEISSAAQDLSHRTEQQAASLEQTSAALEQVTVAVKKTAESSNSARAIVEEAGAEAKESNSIVRSAIAAMGRIEKSSSEISKIIGVIDEIAFQTNLLALNAGVEAARAGDAGRGFAVVASEVRGLAQRSAEAAKEIKDLITASNVQVEEGVRLVAQTGESLHRIVSKVDRIKSVVVNISGSADEQSTALSEVNVAINLMDQATQQNAAMAEQATAAGQSLNAETNRLDRLIGEFALGAEAEMSGPEPLAAAAARKRPRQEKARHAPRKVANGGVGGATDGWAEG